MKSNISKLNRRDFLAKSGLVGTGLVLGAPLFSFGQTDRLSNTVENDNIQINSNLKNKTDLRTRKLGELEVSELGLGCMNIAWAYGNSPSKEG